MSNNAFDATKLHGPNDSFELANGRSIPCLGFGTWQTHDGDVAATAVREAIEAGYRHIDTAAVYGNEQGVGRGIAAAGVPREQLFVTSKVWNTERGYDSTLAAFEKTMDDLGLDYLDLYLIHWPASSSRFSNWEDINRETWRAMEELYDAGRIRAIGVSNFLPHHLHALMDSKVTPMVNQIEFHPGQMQQETVAFCEENGILVQAWSPLGTGRMLGDTRLAAIAKRYGVTVAQLCIRWCLQHGVLPLPKSVTPSRIIENAQVFGFTISPEDMAAIDAFDYFGGSGLHPDEIDF